MIRSCAVTSFLLFLLFTSSLTVMGQSSCSCEAYGCEVNQSCPGGYIAVCSCTASGCSGKCKKEEPEGDSPTVNFEVGRESLLVALRGGNDGIISKEFSKLLRERVVFGKSANFEGQLKTDNLRSYWDFATFLSNYGSFKINGTPYEVLKAHREVLLNGGEFRICSSGLSAQAILNEINFLTGKNFKIIAGDPKSAKTGAVQGFNLNDVLDSLAKSRNVRISS